MCRHFPDAKVTIRSVCCRKFYDCPQCHNEAETHPLVKTFDIAMVCKTCKRAFRKDLRDFDPETDAFCPHCDTEFIMAAEGTVSEPVHAQPAPLSSLAGLDARMIRDGEVSLESVGLARDLTTRLG